MKDAAASTKKAPKKAFEKIASTAVKAEGKVVKIAKSAVAKIKGGKAAKKPAAKPKKIK